MSLPGTRRKTTRTVPGSNAQMRRAFGEPDGKRMDSTNRRIASAGDDLIKALLRLGGRLVGGSLFGGKGGTHGFAEFMLDMEQIGGVMGAELVFDIGHKPRRLIPRGLNHFTVQLS